MSDSRRGAKLNQTKHPREHDDGVHGKKIGHRKQVFDPTTKKWRKV